MPDYSELTARVGEIIEVLSAVREKNPLTLAGIHSIRSEAVKQVAADRGIDSRSVADKCWRGLGLESINQFDDLIWGWLNRGDSELGNLVESQIPSTATDLDRQAVEGFFAEKQRTNVWWVNQGATWKQETDGGYVWAPKTNKAGHVQGHHHSVNRLRRVM